MCSLGGSLASRAAGPDLGSGSKNECTKLDWCLNTVQTSFAQSCTRGSADRTQLLQGLLMNVGDVPHNDVALEGCKQWSTKPFKLKPHYVFAIMQIERVLEILKGFKDGTMIGIALFKSTQRAQFQEKAIIASLYEAYVVWEIRSLKNYWLVEDARCVVGCS